jgi:hypothetical protein
VRPESTLGLPLVSTLGLEMGILEEKPQDLKGELFEWIIVGVNTQNSTIRNSKNNELNGL